MSEALGAILVMPLRGLAWGFYLLPPKARQGAGSALGALLRLLKLRAGVIRQNLAMAFPGELDAGKREALYREAYRHLGNLILEILLLVGPMRRFIETSVELRGIEN